MPWNNGVFERYNGEFAGNAVWQNDRDADYEIEANRHDAHDQDLAQGINACLPRDGSAPLTGDLDLGGFRLVNLKPAQISDELVILGQTITSVTFEGGTLTLTRDAMPDFSVDIAVDVSTEADRAQEAADAAETSAAAAAESASSASGKTAFKETIEEVTSLNQSSIAEGQVFDVGSGAGTGQWRATKTDISAEVTSDPLGGIYRPWDGDDGTNGGVRRIYSGDFDVRWFGAALDCPISGSTSGATDDTDAINQAMLLKSSLGGGRVVVPAGACMVSDLDASGYAVLIPTGVHLAGRGDGVSWLRLADNQNSKKLVKFAASGQHMGISGLTVDGNRDNQASPSISLQGVVGSANMQHVRIIDLEIINVFGRGLESNGDGVLADPLTDPANDIIISRVSMSNCGTKNIHVRRSTNVVVTGCNVSTTAVPEGDPGNPSDNSSAFECSHSMHVSMAGNNAEHLTSGWGVSFRVVNGSQYVAIGDGTGKDGRQGLVVSDSSDVTVNGLNLLRPTQEGVLISASQGAVNSGIVRNVTIQGCTVTDPDNEGLVATVGGTGVGITGLLVYNSVFFDSGVNTMNNGLRNASGAAVVAYQWGNLIVNAQGDDVNGDFFYGSELGIGLANSQRLGFRNSSGALDAGLYLDDSNTLNIEAGASGTIKVVTNNAAAEVVQFRGDQTVDFRIGSNAASVPANFSADRYLQIRAGGSISYIPLMTATW